MLRPGIASGFYPESQENNDDWLTRSLETLQTLPHRIPNFSLAGLRRIIHAIVEQGEQLLQLDSDALNGLTADLRTRLHSQGLTRDLTIEAFALIREIAGRTINMRHFDTQLMGGWIMIQGQLAEMETGEGKTLTATLAAAAAGLAGIPVHVITVNDYLVSRDAELMGPVYAALGLSVGTVTSTMDEQERRTAYRADITYCTNKQLAFDYLRDRIILGNDQGRMRLQLERMHQANARVDRLFLRGLCFAIVDEADSVLIDEARTPLIISRERNDTAEEETYRQAMEIAGQLIEENDFHLNRHERRILLTDRGKEQLEQRTETLGGIWSGRRRREELILQALSARHLYRRDHHYLVDDDTIVIIDENTGRTMADRSWERGLHQMVEIKEHCPLSGQKEHMARMTYQRFFRRYIRLGGMTGTAREVRRELWAVYRLPVIAVPTHRPCMRRFIGQIVLNDKKSKWRRVVNRIRTIQNEGRPILVGTRSVEDSELVSSLLAEAGMVHQVLNARQDAEEAAIVARAGTGRQITVATNMAGRGTDIPLGNGIAEHGGLHIITTERNQERRIDRQLFGRCGRQGDPGQYESILSLEDELFSNHCPRLLQMILLRGHRRDRLPNQRLAFVILHFIQLGIEQQHLRMRRDLLQIDEQLGKTLAFSGRLE